MVRFSWLIASGIEPLKKPGYLTTTLVLFLAVNRNNQHDKSVQTPVFMPYVTEIVTLEDLIELPLLLLSTLDSLTLCLFDKTQVLF